MYFRREINMRDNKSSTYISYGFATNNEFFRPTFVLFIVSNERFSLKLDSEYTGDIVKNHGFSNWLLLIFNFRIVIAAEHELKWWNSWPWLLCQFLDVIFINLFLIISLFCITCCSLTIEINFKNFKFSN